MRRALRVMVALLAIFPLLAVGWLVTFGMTGLGSLIMRLAYHRVIAPDQGMENFLYWLVAGFHLGVPVGLFFTLRYLSEHEHRYGGRPWPEHVLRWIEAKIPKRTPPLGELTKQARSNPGRAKEWI